ncbi:multicopper oxidase domain-containing protein [Thermoactinospora rubra]|uniref:multicopper oxidase domain-containing protein n=1 Tax=Thermoactinospora rubra TaxID=1088767 RepID=UPI00117C4F26|nr:multicopper oxidase domain-containing protein [Thermoactinospora rubra]
MPYRIAAVDGVEVSGRELTAERLPLAAGGRYDLAFTMPAGPVLLTAGGRPMLALGHGEPRRAPAGPPLDITRYATGSAVPPASFARQETWVLDRLLALRDGLPQLSHTVDGRVWPRVPPLVVRRGEWVRLTLVNRSGDHHPMHPHGHHVLVLSRDGAPAGPLWMDSFDVAPGEVWVVALRAGNPGVWLFHCHELLHAAQGMTAHLAYEGYGSPYAIGDAHGNHPE